MPRKLSFPTLPVVHCMTRSLSIGSFESLGLGLAWLSARSSFSFSQSKLPGQRFQDPERSVQRYEVPGVDVLDLLDPAGVLLATFGRPEPVCVHPHTHDLERDLRADDLAADAQNVAVRVRAR